MKQFNITFLLFSIIYMVVPNVFAHDIAVKNADGMTIYYKFSNDGTELTVTYKAHPTNA